MVVIVIVLVGATACGSSSKSVAGSATSTTSAKTSVPGSTASTAPPTTGSLSGSGSSRFCDLARTQNAFVAPSASPTTPVDFKKVYANLGPELQRIGSVIPGAIKSDYDTFVAAFDPFLKAIAAANYDFTKVSPTVFQALSSPQVKAAGTAIRQYITQVCKVTPTT
jgi:hypothetical protein